MVGNPIVVKMIASTIDKTIQQIKDQPQKGMESLVDLANRFASNPVQKDLVVSLKTILSDPTHPYYTLIPKLIEGVNAQTLKTFILNIAHNSWSYGGRRIKQYKKAYNHNIPWAITFDFTSKTDTPLDNKTIIRTIEQGKKIGIYTYLFFADKIPNFAEILKQNLDCAFILHLPPASVTTENIRQIKPYHNTFFSILTQPGVSTQAFKDAAQLLRSNQCLFGSHTYYTDENTDYILSGQWIRDITIPESPFVFLIESPNSNQAKASLIHTYVHNTRLAGQHPVVLIDLYQDMAHINTQLSTGPCTLKITSSGQIHCPQPNPSNNLNIVSTPLLKIFTQ